MYKPVFTISNKILKHIGTIEAAREVITNAPLVPAWERKFQEDAKVRQVHHGTHLEGNALNFSEAARVVAGNDVVGRPRDIQEVINYRNVIDFIGKSARGKSSEGSVRYTATLDLILKLHRLTTERILPNEKTGSLRNTQVVIKNSHTGEVSFRPPAAVEVPFLIEAFTEWLNDQAHALHPILVSGITQYEFSRIHPFVDGNGRVARALATLILYQAGYDIRRFFSLEEYYDHHAVEYYQALQSVERKQGNLTTWLEYFTQGLAIELSRIRDKIKKLSVDVHIKERLGGKQLYLNERQIKIVEYLQEAGFLQNKMFSSLFPMISEDTMLREIQDLIKKGLLVKKGKTKGARYILKQQ